MATDYVEDYEQVTGKKREAPAEAPKQAASPKTKVVTPPDDTPIYNATEAETK